ncbi:hypothetical protein NCU05823 [Neurospora crassa OR74A]|uniref:Uncharacterized protein n=1 Tax=Neurospora crassa (strain ATCC 24698 / 74-OR23-1A / CBS 708.71 / DSM 1257 / FGSC 987) TaxID=367110 RepID=Q7S5M0_NEUCR|nr:hypothetical protein NCU05823 [Neurospora crassa OR74A]EAA30847.1 hypothetical protein NCU05823 [Neurospora crassa OR74A]|eukprot:XP_960083.1 hypothetical protein NCU05823 [Neurospora crassa OR74A]
MNANNNNNNHHHHNHHHHHHNRNHNHLRDRRRNRGRVANPAGVEDRAPPLAAGHHVENRDLVDHENRAPVAPADIRHVEGWGQVDFGNRVLARPVPEDDYDVATFNQSISAEGEADIIRPLITLAVRQMGPSCLFWVSAGPLQAADGPTWIADHHVKAHGDQALARMTVALAVHKWGRGAQISLTARPPPPPPDVAPPPAPQPHYPAPPVVPGAAPHHGEYYYPPPREEYYPPPREEHYPPPHHYPGPYAAPAPAPYQP